MLDEYLWGEVDRISPEAPVQVVAIQKEDFTLGGAGNVVNNVVALGGKVSAVGVIGTGRNGQLLLNIFKKLGVDTTGIVKEPGRTTTQKTRIIAAITQSTCTQNRQRKTTRHIPRHWKKLHDS